MDETVESDAQILLFDYTGFDSGNRATEHLRQRKTLLVCPPLSFAVLLCNTNTPSLVEACWRMLAK